VDPHYTQRADPIDARVSHDSPEVVQVWAFQFVKAVENATPTRRICEHVILEERCVGVGLAVDAKEGMQMLLLEGRRFGEIRKVNERCRRIRSACHTALAVVIDGGQKRTGREASYPGDAELVG
jgi:hypothetical protein